MAENGRQKSRLTVAIRCPSFSVLCHSDRRSRRLLSQSEACDDRLIPLEVSIADVSQQCRPVAHHPEQAAPGGVILGMRSKMFRQIVDSPRQQRDLHLRRSGVSFMDFVIPDNAPFILFS
jgi:hypothetical protein